MTSLLVLTERELLGGVQRVLGALSIRGREVDGNGFEHLPLLDSPVGLGKHHLFVVNIK